MTSLFRADKGFEDAITELGIDSGAVVANHDLKFYRAIFDRNADRHSLAGARFQAIAEEIGQHSNQSEALSLGFQVSSHGQVPGRQARVGSRLANDAADRSESHALGLWPSKCEHCLDDLVDLLESLENLLSEAFHHCGVFGSVKQ